MKVLVADPLDSGALEIMRSHGIDVVVKTSLTPEELLATIPPFDVIAIRSKTRVTETLLHAAASLKLIVRAGVGLDNVDQEAAKKKNILVANTPEATSISVAEHVFALMLALTRHVPDAHASVMSGKWEKQKFSGEELFGKTLGLLGCGRIGREVAKRGTVFGMKVIAHDPFVAEAMFNAFLVKPVSFDQLLNQSDILSLHLPLTPETKHVINAHALAQMKKASRLINCSRGGLVDERAVVAALESGQLKGAAFDVFEEEPAITSPLLGKKGIVLAPHIGASTTEGQQRAGEELAHIVIAFASLPTKK